MEAKKDISSRKKKKFCTVSSYLSLQWSETISLWKWPLCPYLRYMRDYEASVEWYWHGKTKGLFPPEIPHRLDLFKNPGFCGEKLATVKCMAWPNCSFFPHHCTGHSHGSQDVRNTGWTYLFTTTLIMTWFKPFHNNVTQKTAINTKEYKSRDVRFQVPTAASMKFRFVFWDVLPCKIIVDQRFR
jgi:hypothetical protein